MGTRTRAAKFLTLRRDYFGSGTSMRMNQPMSKTRMATLRDRLLSRRFDRQELWPWVSTAPANLTQKDANKYLVGCALNYQMKAQQAWDNARRLIEDILRDPEDVWLEIGRASAREWESRFRAYRLHRFARAHMSLWNMAGTMTTRFSGDARRIWQGMKPDDALERFESLPLGPQLSRMAVGGLIDTGHITGKADVKADIHVRRIVGRLFTGKEMSPEEATERTRALYPANPWELDGPLVSLGRHFCQKRQPKCNQCPLKDVCTYVEQQA